MLNDHILSDNLSSVHHVVQHENKTVPCSFIEPHPQFAVNPIHIILHLCTVKRCAFMAETHPVQ